MRLRTRRHAPTPPSSPSPDAADLARAVEALASMPFGVLVEDEVQRTIVANDRVRNPVGDVQGDALAAEALEKAVARARCGEHATDTLELRGVPPRIFEVSARPLDAGGVLATIVDRSERHRLDAIRRDFVANVNHELRTPIGALSVLAEALLGETEPATVQRLAARITVEADRATNLLGDLLDFGRVEARPLTQPERLPVAEILTSAADRVSAMAERARVRVTLPDAAGIAVTGDRDQLVSAVTNLLDNAVKYSDEGGAVRVSTVASTGMVEIEVADEGIGIPARDLDRVFERFYRVDRARDRRTGGTGLGLAIVRHVASNHGGDITVTSSEGVGSTFRLLLPGAETS